MTPQYVLLNQDAQRMTRAVYYGDETPDYAQVTLQGFSDEGMAQVTVSLAGLGVLLDMLPEHWRVWLYTELGVKPK